ncbi:two-component system sensor histidine kinase YesM [Anaerobacterium chartisolvens]|uniref:Two-component system sensor histidine kinase YesM n=1 Tax=Anaerobacterium chartisolvens TaxID=1297424 RepID=A0A369AIX6_9FIRM|nr:sensor histidine kinase [Anaerobacterium chartisolvens]RCX09349.1 two-component system sensor histidine kinase YesM [Anaerobacterium chartisolvens]
MINYIKKVFFSMQLKWKFFIFTILVSIIPVAFIGIFSYKVSQEYLKESVTKSAIMKSEAVNSKLEKYLSDIDDTSLMLISGYTLQRFLTEQDMTKRYVYRNQLKSMLSSTVSSKTNMQSIIIYDKDGNMCLFETNTSNDMVLRGKAAENISSSGIYPEAQRLMGRRIWTKLFQDVSQVSMIRVVNEMGGQKQIGTIVINVDEDSLRKQIQDIDSEDGEQFIISEQSGGIIYSSTGEEYVPEGGGGYSQSSGHGTITHNNKKYLNIYYISDFCNWRMDTLIPLDVLFSKVGSIKQITIIMMLMCLLLVVAFSILLTNLLTKPITKLSILMGRVEEGDLEIRFHNSYKDEIGRLGQSFNSMIEKTKMLLRENTEKQKRLRIQELKALQAQINPHFLYNTIDTINWMAQAIDADAISEISIALANYYRLSLSRGAEVIRIADEVSQVKNYLTIQKIRYDKYLNYEINISDEILDLHIIKLTLQPIVENAIYHGIKDMLENGIIRIDGRLEAGNVIFEVWDNGKGMSPERLLSVRESLGKIRTEGFGVSNTNERIKLFFGEKYGIEIDSAENIFTRVRVTIPAVHMPEQ